MLSITPPKDLRTNLLWRAFVRGRGDASKRDRARILEQCKHSLDWFCDSFTWQYNPGDENKVGPFILRQQQSAILHRTSERMFRANSQRLRLDTVWRKSREEGASWMALILFVQRALFWEREKFLCVSHTADAVDKSADPDSLFWKIDHIHEHLPEWMEAPRGENRLKMRFWYPKTKSSITGAASTGRSGVGGRASGVLLDELAKQKDAHEIIGQTADTGPRLMVSTFYGTGDAFYAQCQRPDVHIETLHWTHNPEKSAGLYRFNDEKNEIEILDKSYRFPDDYQFDKTGKPNGGPFRSLRSPRYDAECVRRQSDRDVAMHLDIDPEGAGHQFFENRFIHPLIAKYAQIGPCWEGDLEYNPIDATPVKLVRTANGPLKLWMNPRGQNVPPGRYAIACDISAGTGATPSCVCIGDADLGQKIGEYKNANIYPQDFALFFAALGRLFYDTNGFEALAVFENAGGVGRSFEKVFLELGYGNLFWQEVPARFGMMRQEYKKAGWYPRDDAIRSLLESYRTALGTGTFINPSKSALEECLKIVHVPGGKIKHSAEQSESDDPTVGSVNHGDQARADALCSMLMERLGTACAVKQENRKPKEGSFQWRFERGQRADREAEEAWV